MQRWRPRIKCNSTVVFQPRKLSTALAGLQRPNLPKNEDLLHALEDLADAESPTHHVPKSSSAATKVGKEGPVAFAEGLPQSPLTDARLNEARFGHKRSKPRGKPLAAPLNQFQADLQQNPYAWALASSVRQCRLTGTRMPTGFLLSFGLGTHPKTGDQWHLPKIAVGTLFSNNEPDHLVQTSEASAATSADAGYSLSREGHVAPRSLSGEHFMLSYRALDHISSLSQAKRRSILPFRWKNAKGVDLSELIWREDMADFVLDILRRRIINRLKRLKVEGAARKIVSCETRASIDQCSECSAIMVLDGESETKELFRPESGAPHHSDAQNKISFCLAEHGSSRVPVYFMDVLLGESGLQFLREYFPENMNNRFAVVNKGKKTFRLQQNLWKLAGFLG